MTGKFYSVHPVRFHCPKCLIMTEMLTRGLSALASCTPSCTYLFYCNVVSYDLSL